ncbi:MAG TPA: hypothetical protein VJ246_00015 [Patescibacteria group bacterium]|nr:hypothetical protein [Patescibacteria group bacterium]
MKENIASYVASALELALRCTAFAFTADVASSLKEKGVCEQCGAQAGSDLIASHVDHSKRTRHYNHQSNGRALCRKCEAGYHISHIGSSNSIGLREKDNMSAGWSHYQNLTLQEQLELYALYATQIDDMHQRMI